MVKPKLIDCEKHGNDQTAYLVCVHIWNDYAPAAYADPPGATCDTGEAICAQCLSAMKKGKEPKNPKVMCSGHFFESQGLRDDARKQ
jgi:hypothetical protein